MYSEKLCTKVFHNLSRHLRSTPTPFRPHNFLQATCSLYIALRIFEHVTRKRNKPPRRLESPLHAFTNGPSLNLSYLSSSAQRGAVHHPTTYLILPRTTETKPCPHPTRPNHPPPPVSSSTRPPAPSLCRFSQLKRRSPAGISCSSV